VTALTAGSMFTGIGGLDLGLENAGWTVAWQAELDPFCSRVLARHWPDVPNLGDVTTIDWKAVPRVDLIAGGYPCQPFSLAGKQLGELDPRHLWPRMLDAIRVLRPRFALLENVAGHLALGFGRVLGDLAEVGYDAEWDCVPAAAVGAPHRRDRVYVVAYPQRHEGRPQPLGLARGRDQAITGRDGEERDVADSNRGRLEVGPELDGQPPRHTTDGGPQGGHLDGRGHEVADPDGTGSPGRSGQAGRRSGPARRVEPERLGRRLTWQRPARRGDWAAEPDVGRVAHGVPRRVDRLRGLGNAVVPQVAEHVGRLILEAAA
jgi:DNA (cytosine-5)-methyltransferase 1